MALTGNNRTTDVALTVGRSSETVTITSDAAQLNTSDYKIDGVVTRERVEALPLNGRNFLELAQLEPGVRRPDSANPGALANSFTQVQIAGVSGALTRISVDGANVNDRVTGGSATNFSQESVQEFQISTFNYDLSTSVTAVGSVNIVSRSGTNTLHGSGFFFFRDHNMSAYPNLRRSLNNPDPFFARRQAGFSLGGPVKKDKLFWFTNFEYNNQTSVSEVALTRTFGDGGAFASTFDHLGQAPLSAKLFNVRLDNRLNDKHNAFLRYSEDTITAFNSTRAMSRSGPRAITTPTRQSLGSPAFFFTHSQRSPRELQSAHFPAPILRRNVAVQSVVLEQVGRTSSSWAPGLSAVPRVVFRPIARTEPISLPTISVG